jgi:predicted transcriptional regulator of viral defense system
MRADRMQRERAVADLARRQHGVVAFRQLVGLGIGRNVVRRWLECGRLHAVHFGVYAVGHSRLTIRGHWMAAVLACRDGAVLSHRDAGALWDLIPVRSGRIHVTVPRRGARSRRGLVVHSTVGLEPADRCVRDAIPVTSVARTLLDLAETEPQRLPRAWDNAERLQLLDTRAVEDACRRAHGRRALRHLKPLLADRTRAVGDTRLELEARFFDLCRDAGLPLPSCNVLVEGYLVDAVWPRQRLIVELDSWEFHRGRRAFEEDRERDAVLQLAGYRVVRFTWRRLVDRPGEVAALLRRLLAA